MKTELTQEEIENIRKDPKNLDWFGLCFGRKLSEDFIREFKDKICWSVIPMYQTLSEDFIREFQDQINWYFISAYQNLSKEFIYEFYDKICWNRLNYDKELLDNAPRHVKLYRRQQKTSAFRRRMNA